jgi:citronellol/citronellal dehydrogenase
LIHEYTAPTFDADPQQVKLRTAKIMADAALAILIQPSQSYTGQFVIDETILREMGVTDFSKYRVDPNCRDEDLVPDFFIPEDPRAFMTVSPPVKVALSKL